MRSVVPNTCTKGGKMDEAARCCNTERPLTTNLMQQEGAEAIMPTRSPYRCPPADYRTTLGRSR